MLQSPASTPTLAMLHLWSLEDYWLCVEVGCHVCRADVKYGWDAAESPG